MECQAPPDHQKTKHKYKPSNHAQSNNKEKRQKRLTKKNKNINKNNLLQKMGATTCTRICKIITTLHFYNVYI